MNLYTGLVTGGLRAVRTVFRTASGFDLQECTYLNLASLMKTGMLYGSFLNQLQQGTVV